MNNINIKIIKYILPVVVFCVALNSFSRAILRAEDAPVKMEVAPMPEKTDDTAAPVKTPQAAAEPAKKELPKEEGPTPEEIQAAKELEELKSLPLAMRLERSISIDFRNMDIIDAIRYLSLKGALSIVTTKNVSGRVTLSLENTRIKDIFDLMLHLSGLAYDRQGEVLNVMTEVEYKAVHGRNFFDARKVKVFRLKYVIPEQAFTMLDALKSDIGRVLVDQESGNVMVMDTQERIDQIEQVLQDFERKSLVKVFNLKYAKAKEVEDILKSRLDGKKVGSIRSDERNNQVIIQALPGRMEEVENLINSLDQQTKEVLIETKIIKIKLSNLNEKGFEWEGIFKIAEKLGMTYVGSYPFSSVQSASAGFTTREQVLANGGNNIGQYPFSGTTSTFNAAQPTVIGDNVHMGMISTKRDFDTVFKYLQTIGETRVLSNPKIVVVNNQEAKIHVGERQAYVTSTTTQGQSTSTVSEEVNFVDVGIQLSVTPTINEDGFITMKVKPEISSVSSTLITPTKNQIPIVDTSLTETTVMMKDNTTLLIGGLRKDERVKNSAGLPFLSKIPFISYFVSNGSDQVTRTELLVIITPHIISGKNLTTGDERGFGEQPSKEFQDYSPLTPDSSVLPGNIPEGVEIKPFRDYSSGNDEDEKVAPIKEAKYDRE